MKELQLLALSYIKEIKPNLYRLEKYKKDSEKIRKAIIKTKSILGEQKILFSLDDFVLVRIVKEENFPRNFIYYPLDKRNCYSFIRNPFHFIIGWFQFEIEEYKKYEVGCSKKEIDLKKTKIVSYKNRRTKHFSINSLASNIYHFFGLSHEFDKGSCIIIEPLKERIKDKRLVNLNPVDTFFDLKEESMEIGNNAVFLIKEDVYKRYLQIKGVKEKLEHSKVFLYKEEPSLATDLVLLSLGILPEHSKQQSIIPSEYYFEGKKKIDDEKYVEQFKNYIEFLNQHYLHTSYLLVPPSIQKSREREAREFIGLPGVLHSETRFAKEDDKINLDNDLKTYEEYLQMIFSHTSFVDNEMCAKIIEAVKEDIKEDAGLPIEQNFSSTYDKYKTILRDTILEMKYPKFQEYTDHFNQLKLSNLKNNRKG